MLTIFNNLEPFFQDVYRRINVREYGRIRGISAPSASKILKQLEKENLLVHETNRNYLFFVADKESKLLKDLARIYWYSMMKNIGLIEYLEKSFANPTIILFGSLSKAENTAQSDVDLCILTPIKKKLGLKPFEKKLKRTIQILSFPNKKAIPTKELSVNIMNGYVLAGGFE